MTSPTRLGRLLLDHQWARVGEIGVVAAGAALAFAGGALLHVEGPILGQIPVILANAAMLAIVWLGTRARGQRLGHFGLAFGRPTLRQVLRVLGQALLVLVFAVIAFVAGAILMANLTAQPQQADMSQYNSLAGNLPLLLVSLPTVWFFASFGEELIYRGFLIVRISEFDNRVSPWMAVLASALLFGVAHYTWGLPGMVQTGFMGAALGASYLRFGRNLWITVLAHGVMDTVLFIQMYSQPS